MDVNCSKKVESNKKGKNFLIIVILFLDALIFALCIKLIAKTPDVSKEVDVEYKNKYENLEDMSVALQKAAYEEALSAGTSPTEIKYLLRLISANVTPTEKDTMLAEYINHIEYFSTTYTNVAAAYSGVLTGMTEYDFTKRDSAYQISDKVLRNLLLEIFDSNMYLTYEDNVPYIFINYSDISKEFGDIASNATNEYLDISQFTQSAEIAYIDGGYNYNTLKQILDKTNAFIKNYSSYPLVNSVAYKYVVALEMYTGIYGLSTDKEYSVEEIARLNELKADIAENPVAASAAETLISKLNDNVLSAADADDLRIQLEGLVTE